MKTALAERILASLKDLQGNTLPTLSSLARLYQVSIPTVMKAVHILRDQGILDIYRGGRIRIRGGFDPHPPVIRQSAISRLSSHLLSDIESGIYKAGEPLPKRDFFALRDHISTHTVTAAYNELVSCGIASRKGRRWVVGAKTLTPLTTPARSMVIVIVMPRSTSWVGICTSQRTENFGRTLTDAAHQYGIQLMGALTDTDPRDRSGMPAGRHAVLGLLQRLGSRYQGSLLLGQPSEIGGFGEWLSLLTSMRQPVVWFDRLGDEDVESLSPKVIRCHYSEQAGVEAALQFLHSRGHTRIAFFCNNTVSWEAKRSQCAITVSGGLEGLTILPVFRHPPERWNDIPGILADLHSAQALDIPLVNESFDFFRRNRLALIDRFGMTDSGCDHSRDDLDGFIALSKAHLLEGVTLDTKSDFYFRADIIWCALHMTPVLSDKTITAVLFSNDLKAMPFKMWLAKVGIVVPGRLSLMGFDNTRWHDFRSLTSVEFNFGALGYRAIHAIIGDIPLRDSLKRHIPIQPLVVDNGTVADTR